MGKIEASGMKYSVVGMINGGGEVSTILLVVGMVGALHDNEMSNISSQHIR